MCPRFQSQSCFWPHRQLISTCLNLANSLCFFFFQRPFFSFYRSSLSLLESVAVLRPIRFLLPKPWCQPETWTLFRGTSCSACSAALLSEALQSGTEATVPAAREDSFATLIPARAFDAWNLQHWSETVLDIWISFASPWKKNELFQKECLMFCVRIGQAFAPSFLCAVMFVFSFFEIIVFFFLRSCVVLRDFCSSDSLLHAVGPGKLQYGGPWQAPEESDVVS